MVDATRPRPAATAAAWCAHGPRAARRAALATLAVPLLGALVAAALGSAPARAGTQVVGKVRLVTKDQGSTLWAGLSVDLNWLGLVGVRTSIASVTVPKSGAVAVATTHVPGGRFTTNAYVKDDRLTVQVRARADSGASIAKTLQVPADKTAGVAVDVDWTV